MDDAIETKPDEPMTIPGVINALEQESHLKRGICLLLAGVAIIAFLYINLRLSVPVHSGVDQNGYLVGGRMIHDTGSMAMSPRNVVTHAVDPWQFVGRMWVGFDLGTPNERYYPKYPVGLPLIYAGALSAGGSQYGVTVAYLVSPVAMALSLLGVFLMTRLLLGSWSALAVTILMATSPVALSLATNPNSHAMTLLLVAWGMFLVVRWWLEGGWASAIVGGLLVGSAVSIRYTEGMLLLPLTLAVLFRIRDGKWRQRTRWLQGTALLFAWAVPVAALLAYNRVAMGAWTGYGPTNESTGFAWHYFLDNWDTMLRQLYQMGFTLVFPMALGGLAAGFVWNWRVAMFLASWVLPCLLLYTAYYWAPETLNIGYTRFFLTIFPALGVCAFGLLLWPATHLPAADAAIRRQLNRGATLALGFVTAVSVLLGVANVWQNIETDRISRLNLKHRAEQVVRDIPTGSVIVSDDVGLMHHIQFAADYVIYTPEFLTRTTIDRLTEKDPAEPQGLDPGRIKYIARLTEGKTQAQLDALRDDLLQQALAAGKRVFAVSQGAAGRPAALRGLNARFDTKLVENGTDPIAMPRANPLARWGFAPVGRPRGTPTTMPKATWTIHEVVIRPPTTRPLATTRPTTGPATRPVRPTTRPAQAVQ